MKGVKNSTKGIKTAQRSAKTAQQAAKTAQATCKSGTKSRTGRQGYCEKQQLQELKRQSV